MRERMLGSIWGMMVGDALGVPAASYLYQVEVFNASGRFSDVKRMTLLK